MIQLTPLVLSDVAANTLTEFVKEFNALIEAQDKMCETIKQLKAENDELKAKNETLLFSQNEAAGYKRLAEERLQTIEKNNATLATAQKVAVEFMANKRELELLRTKATTLQQEITKLKSSGNPTKLKAQVKRVKEKSAEKDTLITQQKQKHQENERRIKQLNTELSEIKKKQSASGMNSVYHNGDNHLIVWPQKTKVQSDDGSVYEGRSLLWMHQSGTGKLITFDKDNFTSVLCKAPKGGAKLPSEVREFADNWLFNVNVTQHGELTESDLACTDLNA